MKNTVLSLAFLAASGLTLGIPAASVRASGSTTTLPTMYHLADEEGAMFLVLHNSPMSIVTDKDRYSPGDKLVFGGPLYGTKDLAKGGKTIGQYYGEATVLKGDAPPNLLIMMHYDFIFPNGDHITGQGVVNWGAKNEEVNLPITGGTGAYEGVRGTDHHKYGIDTLDIIR